jgi:adenine-specific DNA-methyltransferase
VQPQTANPEVELTEDVSLRSNPVLARLPGPRGSRAPIGHGDPAQDPGDRPRGIMFGLGRWWRDIAERCGLDGQWLVPEEAIDGLRAAPHSDVSSVLKDLSAEEVGARYSGSLEPGFRSRHGRHYTPANLAQELWSLTKGTLGQGQSGPLLPGLVCDPACGAGALLLPPLRQHLAAVSDVDPRMVLAHIPRLIKGIDSDPHAVWIANVVLAAELLPTLSRVPKQDRRLLPRLAHVGDGITDDWGSACAVVMNPPYGRVRLGSEERSKWDRYLYGHANLYSLFMASSIENLERGGVMSALVPTSFLAGRYFSSLREEIARQASLRSLTFVKERGGVFAGVIQETCLATFTKKRSRRLIISSANGRVTPVAKVGSPRGGNPWVLPRHTGDALVAAAASSMPLTLRSAGWRVSTGPLVWNRRRKDLSSRRRKNSAPIVWAADLDGQVLHRDKARSEFRWLSLGATESDGILLTDPAVLVQRTTSPEQARRINCVNLSERDLREWGGAVVVENHVNVIRPVDGEPQLLSLATLAAVLSTRTMDRLARCISGSVAVSAYELESLPLPDSETLQTWESLRGDELESAVSAAYRPER